MSARRITILHVTPAMSVVTGWGSRELVTELRGRPPMWSSRPRGWVVQPSTAADLVPFAESRGYLVLIEREAA